MLYINDYENHSLNTHDKKKHFFFLRFIQFFRLYRQEYNRTYQICYDDDDDDWLMTNSTIVKKLICLIHWLKECKPLYPHIHYRICTIFLNLFSFFYRICFLTLFNEEKHIKMVQFSWKTLHPWKGVIYKFLITYLPQIRTIVYWSQIVHQSINDRLFHILVVITHIFVVFFIL